MTAQPAPLTLSPEEFALFRDFIERSCGIHLGSDKAYLVEHRLARLVKTTGCRGYADLYHLARREKPMGQLSARIIDAITTNETSWYRDPKQFVALKSRLLPELWERIRDGRRTIINLWSAACATGQEPYTMAMVVLDFLRGPAREPETRDRFRILATDISETSLTMAREAKYDETAMSRGLDEDQTRRYFKKTGPVWTVAPEIRRLVDFKPFNLRDPFTGLGPFDVVFLRNVVIYFSDELKREVFRQVARCLTPKGWLFLGTGETVTGLSDVYEIEEVKGAILYRLK
jgi:chemotaxis protein methyltransferase CheR